MSGGKEAVRDLRHGRRGGGWVPFGAEAAEFDRACADCGRPMICNQHARHVTCCMAAGGLATHKDACNPVQRKGDHGQKIDACGACHLGGTS